jgi:hypothetical protein
VFNEEDNAIVLSPTFCSAPPARDYTWLGNNFISLTWQPFCGKCQGELQKIMAWSRSLKIGGYVATILVCSALAFTVAHVYGLSKSAAVENKYQLHGLKQMSETELRNMVSANRLIVYWAGPTRGATYLLDEVDPTNIVLTIIPPGMQEVETRATYPQVITYVQKDAFKAVLTGGGKSEGAGFINADGNAVCPSEFDSKSTFVGFKGKDVEVYIFDSRAGVSLGIAKEAGRLTPVTALKS